MEVTSAEGVGRCQTRALGTRVEILTADPNAIAAAAGLLQSSLEWIDGVASRFRGDSELSKVNARAGRAVSISADLVEMLAVALRAALITDGVVTPTIGRAIRQIGYDRDFSDIQPDDWNDPLPPAKPVPAWESIALDPLSGTVRMPPNVQIDLGATAKAWAADRIAARGYESLGCGVMVSLGGDVSLAGPPPPGGWRVGVADRCEADTTEADAVVILQDGGLATSGTARSWRRAGRTVHHLIDPANGLPADSCWRTVSVAAASCVDANIASTAALIKGAGTLEWLAARGLPARLVGKAGQVALTGGWPASPER